MTPLILCPLCSLYLWIFNFLRLVKNSSGLLQQLSFILTHPASFVSHIDIRPFSKYLNASMPYRYMQSLKEKRSRCDMRGFHVFILFLLSKTHAMIGRLKIQLESPEPFILRSKWCMKMVTAKKRKREEGYALTDAGKQSFKPRNRIGLVFVRAFVKTSDSPFRCEIYYTTIHFDTAKRFLKLMHCAEWRSLMVVFHFLLISNFITFTQVFIRFGFCFGT